MGRYVLTVIVAAAILFVVAAVGAEVLVITHQGTDFFSQQIFWWSLGIACLAIPVASILWTAGTAWTAGGVTAVLLAAGWVTAIASAGGMFVRTTLPYHPWEYFAAAVVATVAMAVAWVAFSALGRRLSRNWASPFRVLAVLGYWVLIGAAFAYPWVYLWVPQFYGDMLAMPTTTVFMLMEGPYYPVVIYHTMLGISLGLFIASVVALRWLQHSTVATEVEFKQ